MGRPLPAADVRSSIDFGEIARRANLRALVEADPSVGPSRGRKYRCPFHDDNDPSMSLYTGRDGAARFQCHACGAKGTALDWLARREGLSLVEAAHRLDPSIPAPTGGRRKRAGNPRGAKVEPASGRSSPSPSTVPGQPEPDGSPTWCSSEWQGAVDGLVCRAEAVLWNPAGQAALDWLRSRGLTDLTIRRFRLGYLPDAWTETAPLDVLSGEKGSQPIRAPRGVTIPWGAPGSWYDAAPDPDGVEPGPRWCGVNVRRLAVDPFAPLPAGTGKCLAVAGSTRGHAYPWPDLPMPGIPVLIVEGELDALLGWQAVGWAFNVATVGGAQQEPTAAGMEFLRACGPWLIGTDHDGPGDRAARRFRTLAPFESRRVYLPGAKDLGEFVQAGGNVAAWLTSEFERMGLVPPWALRNAAAQDVG